jgi:hypothetical protein
MRHSSRLAGGRSRGRKKNMGQRKWRIHEEGEKEGEKEGEEGNKNDNQYWEGNKDGDHQDIHVTTAFESSLPL